jgi:WD40 repeat protein
VKPLGISHYLVVALDERSRAALDAHNIPTCFLPKDSEVLWTEQGENFGTVGFKAICNEKPFLVNEILKDGWNVLWTDVDIVWLGDPYQHFIDVDLNIQSDDDGVCAGFFFIKHNQRSLDWMHRVVEYLNPLIDDQISMRRMLADNPQLEFNMLSRLYYPNGSAFFDMKLPQRANVKPIVIHNNCIIGHDPKVRRFQQYGLWLVPTHARLSTLDHAPNAVEPLFTLRGHQEIVTCLAVHNDSGVERLFSGSYDKSLRVWDTTQRKCITTKFLNRRGGFWSMRVDGATLWTGSHDKTVQQWEIAVCAFSFVFRTFKLDLCFALDFFVKSSHKQSWKCINTFDGHLALINDVDVGGDLVFAAGDDHTIRSWNVRMGERCVVYKGHTSWVSAIKVRGAVLYSASHDGTARAWAIKTGRCMQIYQCSGWVRCIDVRGETLFTGDQHSISEWNVREGTCTRSVRVAAVSSILVHGDALFSGHDDGVARVWRDQRCISELRAHNATITCIAVGDAHIYTGSHDRRIVAWPVPK